jgi:hypothetical protein
MPDFQAHMESLRAASPAGEAAEQHTAMWGFARALDRASRALSSTIICQLELVGLDLDRWRVLCDCTAEGSAVSLSTVQISARLNMGLDAVTAAAEHLARGGWVTLEGSLLVPSVKAWRALPALVGVSAWSAELALSGFTNAEVADLRAMLDRIPRNLA